MHSKDPAAGLPDRGGDIETGAGMAKDDPGSRDPQYNIDGPFGKLGQCSVGQRVHFGVYTRYLGKRERMVRVYQCFLLGRGNRRKLDGSDDYPIFGEACRIYDRSERLVDVPFDFFLCAQFQCRLGARNLHVHGAPLSGQGNMPGNRLAGRDLPAGKSQCHGGKKCRVDSLVGNDSPDDGLVGGSDGYSVRIHTRCDIVRAYIFVRRISAAAEKLSI